MEKKDQVPFAVIIAAADGDEIAIKEIINVYDSYITKLSLRPMRDEFGNVYMILDSELKGRIQSAVINMVLNFEITVI